MAPDDPAVGAAIDLVPQELVPGQRGASGGPGTFRNYSTNSSDKSVPEAYLAVTLQRPKKPSESSRSRRWLSARASEIVGRTRTQLAGDDEWSVSVRLP